MHEASIVESLLETVIARAPAGARVRGVRVRVGEFTAVSPAAMEFYFEALRGERIGEQAELIIEREPLRAWCGACGREWSFGQLEWTCPGCGAAQLNYANGMELDLVAIEVEDAGDDPDRGEDPGQERGVGPPQP